MQLIQIQEKKDLKKLLKKKMKSKVIVKMKTTMKNNLNKNYPILEEPLDKLEMLLKKIILIFSII